MPFPLLLLAAIAGSPQMAPKVAAFDLKGARLGMSLQEWRALPYPGSGPGAAKIRTVCSADPDANSTGLQLAADQQAGTIVCAYVIQYGRYFLPESLDLAPKYPTHRLRYYFQQDHLFRIEYQLSVDAYNALVGDFDTHYGRATKLVRDTLRTELGQFSRVTQTWATAGLLIEIIDPAPPAYDLSLSFISTAPQGATPRTSSKLSADPHASSG